jgi:hypothetical protein
VIVRYPGGGDWTLTDERIPVRAAQVTNLYTGTGNEALTLLIHPGHHIMRLRVQSEEQGTWEFDSTGGASLSHVFEPKSAPGTVAAGAAPDPDRTKPSSRILPLATIGAGGLALAASAITGVTAFVKMKDLERECPGNVCPNASYHTDLNTAQTLGTTTDTLLVVGGALAVSGAIWLGVSGGAHKITADAPAVGAACLPGGCGVTVRGGF